MSGSLNQEIQWVFNSSGLGVRAIKLKLEPFLTMPTPNLPHDVNWQAVKDCSMEIIWSNWNKVGANSVIFLPGCSLHSSLYSTLHCFQSILETWHTFVRCTTWQATISSSTFKIFFQEFLSFCRIFVYCGVVSSLLSWVALVMVRIFSPI